LASPLLNIEYKYLKNGGPNMKPQNFAKLLAAFAMLTALAGVATAATMAKGTMTKPCPTPIVKPMM
jgi:hypothetical protein